MFRTNEYNAWDDEGVPTRDAASEETTKSRAKKLKKDWERQKKLDEAWLVANGAKRRKCTVLTHLRVIGEQC